MMRRAASIIAKVDYEQVKTGTLNEEDEQIYFEALEALEAWEKESQRDGRRAAMHFISDRDMKGAGTKKGVTVDILSAEAERFGADLVLVDGFYLMRDGRTGVKSRDWKQIGNISSDIKEMAQTLGVPVIGTTQANRGASKTVGDDVDEIGYDVDPAHRRDFYDGVKHLAELYKSMVNEVKVVEVDAAIQEFAAVTLPETVYEAGITADAFGKRVDAAIKALTETRYNYFNDYYGKILQARPDDQDANINLGILNGQYNKNKDAEAYFNKVLEKEPVNAAALTGLGNLYFNRGKFTEARDYYFKATKADPYDAHIWLNLARVSRKLNNKEDTQTFVDRAAKLDPDVKVIGTALLK